MKKYARLRSTSSLPEQCEPCGEGKPDVASSTTLSLDDDGDAAASGKWNSLKFSPPVQRGSKHDHGVNVSSSSSHRVLADALKKLSSLRETHHDLDDSLPRCARTTHSWGTRIVSDSDAGGGEPHSFFPGIWQSRPHSVMGSEQPSSYRSNSNGGSVGSSIQGIVRTESSCTHTSHFTHRRSSSMHDVTTLGDQSSAARPATCTSMAISGLNPRQPSKAGLVPCFQDSSQEWSPSQLRYSSTSAPAAPSTRRLPIVSAISPLQLKSCSLWEENDDPKSFVAGKSSGKRANTAQSMRYDRLHSSGLMGIEIGKEEKELQSQSMREGAAHAQAIAAMAKAYAEKYGIAQAVVECVSCGRGLGVIVEGNSPGSYDSSFCRSCRPPVLPLHASSASSSSSWKKGASGVSRGMMHYCRKLLLRMGKKPSHKYTMV